MTIFGRVIVLPRSAWPDDLRHPEVKGVAVGGCGVSGKRLHGGLRELLAKPPPVKRKRR